MYYIIYLDDAGHLCIMQREFETLDQAYLRLAWFSPESEARVVEKHKTIRERVVIKKKPEPVWRELAIPPEPTGKHHLAELLRQKLNGG
jgi:hypothetical protein